MLVDKRRQITAEMRNSIGLGEVDGRGSRRKIPNQVVGDKSPWQKVVQIVARSDGLARIDTLQRLLRENRVPESACFHQIPHSRSFEFIDDPGDPRVPRFKISRHRKLSEGSEWKMIGLQKGQPFGMTTIRFGRPITASNE